jgi:hypothetical protein
MNSIPRRIEEEYASLEAVSRKCAASLSLCLSAEGSTRLRLFQLLPEDGPEEEPGRFAQYTDTSCDMVEKEFIR